MPETSKENNVVVRLLNGALRGCEFYLPVGRTVFLLTDESELGCHHQGTILPENTIFVPSKAEQFNFEIDVEDSSAPAITLTELLENETNEYPVSTNQIISVGSLKLALRYPNDRFSVDIENFWQSELPPSEQAAAFFAKPKIWRWLACLALTGSMAMVGLFYVTSEQRQISSLASLLNSRIGHYEIIAGRDSVMYVIASDTTGMVWASQTLAKSAMGKEVRVLSRSKVSEDIANWFTKKYPQQPLRRVISAQSLRPVLEISEERNKMDKQNQQAIVRSARTAFPYLDTVHFSFISDTLISDIAEQGLQKIAVPYTRVNNPQSVTFIIQGSLDDSEFERLKVFIDGYYSSWRSEYVQFAIEIKDDWLKGKSFKYGSRGYVNITPGHWYFPKPL